MSTSYIVSYMEDMIMLTAMLNIQGLSLIPRLMALDTRGHPRDSRLGSSHDPRKPDIPDNISRPRFLCMCGHATSGSPS